MVNYPKLYNIFNKDYVRHTNVMSNAVIFFVSQCMVNKSMLTTALNSSGHSFSRYFSDLGYRLFFERTMFASNDKTHIFSTFNNILSCHN